MTQSVCKVFILFIMVVGLSGCSEKDENSGSVNNVGGIIEKGPFLTGSKVILYELDETLNQTGKTLRRKQSTIKENLFFRESNCPAAMQSLKSAVTFIMR